MGGGKQRHSCQTLPCLRNDGAAAAGRTSATRLLPAAEVPPGRQHSLISQSPTAEPYAAEGGKVVQLSNAGIKKGFRWDLNDAGALSSDSHQYHSCHAGAGARDTEHRVASEVQLLFLMNKARVCVRARVLSTHIK